MKCLSITTALFIVSFGLFGQVEGLHLDWGFNVGSSQLDVGRGIDVDEDGSVYSVGYFQGEVDFDHGNGVTQITSQGNEDAFILKTSSDGAFNWVVPLQSSSGVRAFNIRSAPGGGVVIVGFYSGDVDFDPDSTVQSAPASTIDFFVLKLTSEGALDWLYTAGDFGVDQATALDISMDGSVYVGGTFQQTVDFDPSSTVSELTAQGTDAFVLKLNQNGQFQWVKKLGGSSGKTAESISVDNSEEVFISGSFAGTVDLDPGAGSVSYTSLGNTDSYLVKLDSLGNYLWSWIVGGAGQEFSGFIDHDPLDNLYMSGRHPGTSFDFDPGPDTFQVAQVGSPVYVVKLDSNQDFVWANSCEQGFLNTRCMTVDQSGSVYVSGEYLGPVDFNPSQDTFLLNSVGSVDYYVFKWDSTGEFDWAFDLNSQGQNCGFGIAVDGEYHVYGTGFISDSIDLAPGEQENLVQSNGQRDIACLKVGQCVPILVDTQIVACDSFVWIDGNTFYESQVILDTILSVDSCDSIIHISLEVFSSYRDTLQIEACNEYYWPALEQTIDSSGLYFFQSQSQSGCDSTIVLNLTITKVEVDIVSFSEELLATGEFEELQWYKCLSPNEIELLPTENDTILSLLTNDKFSNYLVIGSSGECADTSDCVSGALGQFESIQGQSYRIRQNQNGSISIENVNQESFELRAYSLDGSLIFENQFRSGHGDINVDRGVGLIILEMINEVGESHTKRILLH